MGWAVVGRLVRRAGGQRCACTIKHNCFYLLRYSPPQAKSGFTPPTHHSEHCAASENAFDLVLEDIEMAKA